MYKKQITIIIFFLITNFLASAIPVEAQFSNDQFESISTALISNNLDFLNNGASVPPVFIKCTNGIHNQSPKVTSIQKANQVCRDTRNPDQLLFNCIRRETTYSCDNRVNASQVNQQPSGNVQQEQTRIREKSLDFARQQFRFQGRTFDGECSISNTMDNLAVCRRPDAGAQRYYGCVDSVDPLATVRFNCSFDKGIINTNVNSLNDTNISQSELEALQNQAFDPGGIGSGDQNTSSPSSSAGPVSYTSYTNFPGVGRISSLCQLITALWLLGFAVLLTSVLGMFLWGGYIYVTAGVNAGKVNQAKEIFTNTITGLIIGLSIFIIINIINPGLLQGNCSIPSVGSTGTGASQPTFGGPGGIPSAGTPCDSSNPNIKCIKPGEVSRIDITSCYLRDESPYPGAYHGGTDWVVSGAGKPVAILTAGQVVDVCRGSCGGFGNSVVIKGPSQGGYDLYNYSHMASIASGISKGMNLGRGTIIGIEGGTGGRYASHVDTKISNCVLCKRQGSQFSKPTKVLMQYMKETYGVDPVCGCRNGCNDT